jgi:hypothetical protein
LHSISKNEKVMLIDDLIGQNSLEKVYITSIIYDTGDERKVTVKMLFQSNENDQKNKAEMREIIRKTCDNVDKSKLVSDIYYFEMSCHRKCNTMAYSFNCLFQEWMVRMF